MAYTDRQQHNSDAIARQFCTNCRPTMNNNIVLIISLALMVVCTMTAQQTEAMPGFLSKLFHHGGQPKTSQQSAQNQFMAPPAPPPVQMVVGPPPPLPLPPTTNGAPKKGAKGGLVGKIKSTLSAVQHRFAKKPHQSQPFPNQPFMQQHFIVDPPLYHRPGNQYPNRFPPPRDSSSDSSSASASASASASPSSSSAAATATATVASGGPHYSTDESRHEQPEIDDDEYGSHEPAHMMPEPDRYNDRPMFDPTMPTMRAPSSSTTKSKKSSYSHEKEENHLEEFEHNNAHDMLQVAPPGPYGYHEYPDIVVPRKPLSDWLDEPQEEEEGYNQKPFVYRPEPEERVRFDHRLVEQAQAQAQARARVQAGAQTGYEMAPAPEGRLDAPMMEEYPNQPLPIRPEQQIYPKFDHEEMYPTEFPQAASVNQRFEQPVYHQEGIPPPPMRLYDGPEHELEDENNFDSRSDTPRMNSYLPNEMPRRVEPVAPVRVQPIYRGQQENANDDHGQYTDHSNADAFASSNHEMLPKSDDDADAAAAVMQQDRIMREQRLNNDRRRYEEEERLARQRYQQERARDDSVDEPAAYGPHHNDEHELSENKQHSHDDDDDHHEQERLREERERLRDEENERLREDHEKLHEDLEHLKHDELHAADDDNDLPNEEVALDRHRANDFDGHDHQHKIEHDEDGDDLRDTAAKDYGQRIRAPHHNDDADHSKNNDHLDSEAKKLNHDGYDNDDDESDFESDSHSDSDSNSDTHSDNDFDNDDGDDYHHNDRVTERDEHDDDDDDNYDDDDDKHHNTKPDNHEDDDNDDIDDEETDRHNNRDIPTSSLAKTKHNDEEDGTSSEAHAEASAHSDDGESDDGQFYDSEEDDYDHHDDLDHSKHEENKKLHHNEEESDDEEDEDHFDDDDDDHSDHENNPYMNNDEDKETNESKPENFYPKTNEAKKTKNPYTSS